MLFETLYRDVYSRLNLQGDDHSLYYGDIVKAINDAIRTQRIEYVKQGQASDFSTSEILSSFAPDSTYSDLNFDTLTNNVLQDVSVGSAILTAISYETTNTLEDTTQSFSKGDIAVKNGTSDTYQALEDISSTNTFDSTFEADNVRYFRDDDGIAYNANDVLYDGTNFYRVNTAFTADGTDQSANYDKLLWRKVGGNYKEPDYYPLDRLRELTLYDNATAFGVEGDKVYTTPNIKQLNVSYVPKWQYIDSLETSLTLPDYMIDSVKRQALRQAAIKLNISLPDEQSDS